MHRPGGCYIGVFWECVPWALYILLLPSNLHHLTEFNTVHIVNVRPDIRWAAAFSTWCPGSQGRIEDPPPTRRGGGWTVKCLMLFEQNSENSKVSPPPWIVKSLSLCMILKKYIICSGGHNPIASRSIRHWQLVQLSKGGSRAVSGRLVNFGNSFH